MNGALKLMTSDLASFRTGLMICACDEMKINKSEEMQQNRIIRAKLSVRDKSHRFFHIFNRLFACVVLANIDQRFTFDIPVI